MSLLEMSPEQLIGLFYESDGTLSDDAYTAMFHRFETSVRKIAYAMLRDLADVEEVVQEVFLKLTESKLSGPRWPTNDVQRYLFRVTKNNGLDQLRRRGRNWNRSEELTDQHAPTIENPERALLRKERREDLRDCWRRMPPDLRSVLNLRLQFRDRQSENHLTLPEIAAILDLTIDRARYVGRRAEARLADCMKRKGYRPDRTGKNRNEGRQGITNRSREA